MPSARRLLMLVTLVVVGAVGPAGADPGRDARVAALRAERQLKRQQMPRAFVAVPGTAVVVDGLLIGSASAKQVGGDRREVEREAVRLAYAEAVRLLKEAEPDVGIAVHEQRAQDEMRRVDTRSFTDDHAVDVVFTLPFEQGPRG